MGTGRPVDVEKRRERQDALLAAFIETGTITNAAKESGVVHTQHYAWMKTDSDYAERFAQLSQQVVASGVAKQHQKPRKRGYKVGGQRGAERDARQEAFLAALAELGVIADAARHAGIALNTHHQWVKSDPDYTAKYQQVIAASADIGQQRMSERRSEVNKAIWADPERRAAQSERHKQRWTPELRAEQGQRVRELAKDPAVRAARSAAAKEIWADPEHRARHGQDMRKRWNDPEFRAKVTSSMARPEVRERLSRAARERWAGLTPEQRKAHMRHARRTFKGGYRLTKIEATVMVALNERELPYFVHKPVDGYVADLLVPSLNLVIECDGAYHHDQRPDSDAARDVAMQELGYEVLRLSQDEITNKLWGRLDETIGRLST